MQRDIVPVPHGSVPGPEPVRRRTRVAQRRRRRANPGVEGLLTDDKLYSDTVHVGFRRRRLHAVMVRQALDRLFFGLEPELEAHGQFLGSIRLNVV